MKRHRFHPSAPLLSMTLVALSACTTPAPPSGASASSWPLEGTYWRLASVGGQPAGAAANEREASLMLDAGQRRAAGFAGCNQFFAGYELAGTSLRFNRPGATLMACPEMAREQAYLNALAATAGWRIVGEQLQLIDAQGRAQVEFSAGSVRYACDGQPPVLVHYDNRDPQRPRALLSFDGKSYAMHSVRAASGARYATEQGRAQDMSLEWHTQAADGLLMEAPLDHARRAADLKTVARCTRQP